MTNNIKERTEKLREDFKLYATKYKMTTEILTEAMRETLTSAKRDDKAIGTATVLVHALLGPTNDFAENELQTLENNLENIYEDRRENYLDMIAGELSTLNELLITLNDNIKKLHIQTSEEVNNND